MKSHPPQSPSFGRWEDKQITPPSERRAERSEANARSAAPQAQGDADVRARIINGAPNKKRGLEAAFFVQQPAAITARRSSPE
jgi:hypothetical protein